MAKYSPLTDTGEERQGADDKNGPDHDPATSMDVEKMSFPAKLYVRAKVGLSAWQEEYKVRIDPFQPHSCER